MKRISKLVTILLLASFFALPQMTSIMSNHEGLQHNERFSANAYSWLQSVGNNPAFCDATSYAKIFSADNIKNTIKFLNFKKVEIKESVKLLALHTFSDKVLLFSDNNILYKVHRLNI